MSTVTCPGYFLMLYEKGEDLQLEETTLNPPDGYSQLLATGWPTSSVSAALYLEQLHLL